MNRQLCQRLKRKRLEAGKTQEDMAQALKIQRSTYGEYERGKISPPSEKVELMAKILGTTPQYLYGWDENEINTVAEMQLEKVEYENIMGKAAENIYNLNLTYSEMQEVYDFAQFLKHKRTKKGDVN